MTDDERREHCLMLARKRNAKYRALHKSRVRVAAKARREVTREQRNAYNKAYRQAHREEIRAYRASKRAETRVYLKAYYKANRERLAPLKKAYHAANREQWNAYAKAYYANHKEQFREYAERNKEVIAQRSATRRKEKRAHYNALQRKRDAMLQRAMPSWANEDAIEAMYQAARRLTLETGIQFDVDHIVPLKGRNVCGLHVEYNLQVITHAANVRKHNTFPYEGVA